MTTILKTVTLNWDDGTSDTFVRVVAAPPPPPPPPAPIVSFLQVIGTHLSYNGQIVTLRGENFNNEPALGCCGGPDIAKINVNAFDYAKAASLGLNAIRFGMDWKWYNTNKTQFFTVLDQHVAWAKANHLWLLPVIYEGPGADFGGYNAAAQANFWNSLSMQDALIAFWVDFATHYASEPTIAGFDIINEPAPPTAAAYTAWAQRTYDALAAIEPNHFVALTNSSAGWNLPDVIGTRILWQGHCYATVGTNGCNLSQNNPQTPDRRPFLVGEVGSTLNSGVSYVPSNLAYFNLQELSWCHFVMHEVGFGLYQTWGAGDFSNPYTAMIQAVQAATIGAIKP